MQSKHRIAKLTILASAALLLIPGCLERQETITVHPDGAVHYLVQLKGDPADFTSGDALPEKAAGWTVTESIELKDNGEQEQHRRAERTFKPGQTLPDSFADPDDANYGVALMFPTSITIERRPDGVYYHFQRVYHARAQARYDRWREKLEREFDDIDEITDADPESLTDEQRMRLFEFFRRHEACQQSEYVAAGAQALEDQWPQHFGLLLREALFDYFNAADIKPLAELITQPDTPERNAAINAAAERLLSDSRQALAARLDELDVTPDQVELFFAAHDEELARRAVTEDLDDDSMKIRVQLPGQIVAHNADQIGPDGLTWDFNGKILHDCDLTLMATTRIPQEQ